MAYVDAAYYRDVFGGAGFTRQAELSSDEARFNLPRYASADAGSAEEAEFTRLLRAASDVIDMVAYQPIVTVTDHVKKAVCYEAEMLYIQGGADALAGLSVSGNGVSEQLGDYRVTRGSGYAQMINSEKHPLFVNGIPISPVAVELLRRDGLMSRLVK